MLKKEKIIALIFACVNIVQVFAQNIDDRIQTEEIKIHASQQVLFSGDVLWFSLFSSNTFAEKDLSTVAFVELINSNNTSVLRKKVKLSNGRGNSYFNLPDSLSTGIYKMLAYTSWMKNFNENLFPTLELSIINPAQPLNSSTRQNGFDTLTISKTSVSSIDTQKHLRLKKRTKVKLADLIDDSMLNGSVSVTVKRKEPVLFSPANNGFIEKSASFNNEIYYPDYKGIIISGRLYGKNNQIVTNQEVLLSLPGAGVDLLSSVSDKNGKFNFLLVNEKNNSDLVFILPDSEMKIKLEDPYLKGINYKNNNFLQIDTFAMNFLNEKYFYTQVAQKFGNTEYEQIPEDTVKKQAFTFYSTPNRTYRTEDYIFLDSVAEYFHELIPGVHFYREKNKFELRVIEPKNKMEIGNKPGVFVDGVFYSDFNNLAKMPTEKLDYIEVLWEKYYYKDFVFDGIVSIHSKTSNFYAVDLQKNMTRVIYTLTDRNNIHFKSIIYAENNISSKLPDVRYLLYWNPEVDLANIDNLNFYTSDVAGLYEIAISGFTLTGEWVTVTNEFHVQ